MDIQNIHVFEGQSEQLTIKGYSTNAPSKLPGVKVVLPGDFTEVQQTDPEGKAIYQFTLKVSDKAAPGTRSGNILVWLCQGSSYPCKTTGSPWSIPYSIAVTQKSFSLKTLSVLRDAPAWKQSRGNAARTGYVPTSESLNSADFSLRWEKAAGSAAVAMDGYVYSTGEKLQSLTESDGSVKWEADAWAPISSNGRLFAYAADNQTSKWQIRSIDAGTGALLKTYSDPGIDHQNKWELVLAGDMVVSDDNIYINDDSKYLFNATTGALQWKKSVPTGQESFSIPSMDEKRIYTLDRDYFRAASLKDPSDTLLIPAKVDMVSSRMSSTAVIGADQVIGSFFGYNGWFRLTSFSISQGKKIWELTSGFLSEVAFADGVIYVVNAPGDDSSIPALEARDAATGSLLWTTVLPNRELPFAKYYENPYNLVVVGDWIFASPLKEKAAATYAVNRKTHAIGWQYPVTGRLSVSDRGLLYINQADGKLFAFNLH